MGDLLLTGAAIIGGGVIVIGLGWALLYWSLYEIYDGDRRRRRRKPKRGRRRTDTRENPFYD